MLTRKIDTLRSHMDAEDWPAAIKLAAKFPRLGEHKAVITRAKDALLRPAFFRQIGKDPEALVELGRQALIARYPRPGPGHRP